MILQMTEAFKTDAASASNDQMTMRRNAHHHHAFFMSFVTSISAREGLVSQRDAPA